MQLQPGDTAAGTTLIVVKHRGTASAILSNLRSALQGYRKKYLLKAVIEPGGSGTLHETHAACMFSGLASPGLSNIHATRAS